MTTLTVVDEMIGEVLAQQRRGTRPVMGGANQVPFDGEVLGSFIRYAILHEVRDRLTGETSDKDALIEHFNEVAALSTQEARDA